MGEPQGSRAFREDETSRRRARTSPTGDLGDIGALGTGVIVLVSQFPACVTVSIPAPAIDWHGIPAPIDATLLWYATPAGSLSGTPAAACLGDPPVSSGAPVTDPLLLLLRAQ